MRFFILYLTFFYWIAGDMPDNSGSLKVKMIGIGNNKGQILISIYNDPKTFPKTKNMLEQQIVFPVIEGEMTFEFKNLKIGEKYAIAALHDEDSNGKMTKNLIRLPKEGFCFSNNYKPSLRAPNFDECSFVLDENAVITIEMFY